MNTNTLERYGDLPWFGHDHPRGMVLPTTPNSTWAWCHRLHRMVHRDDHIDPQYWSNNEHLPL